MQETENLVSLWRSTHPEDRNKQELPFRLVEQVASVFATGPFYYFVLDCFESKIEFVHPNIQDVLGISPANFTLKGYRESVHPDYLRSMQLKEEAATHFLSEEIPAEKILNYKVVYLNRIQAENGASKTILHQAITLAVTENHEPEMQLVIHTDVSHLDFPLDQKISFIGLSGEPSWICLDPENPDFIKEDFTELFSDREKEILSLISEGYDSDEIANLLNISVMTVRTHRKNILSKTSCRNTTELIAKCIKAGLI